MRRMGAHERERAEGGDGLTETESMSETERQT